MPVNTFAFDQEPMTSKQLGVMQMFPFPGKQGVRENIARENAAVAEARYQELRNQLVKNVKATYFDLFLVDKSIETVQKNLEILQEFVRIAETKYSVGSGLQQDVLRAQVELSKMTDKLINLQKKRDAVEARLNALLNRPAENLVGATEELVFKSFEYDFEQLKQLADEDRPLLQAWQAMIRQSEQQVRLAKKEYLPDFSLGVVYSQREELQNGAGGVDFLSGMINVKLPLYFWRKQKKQVEESRYNQISVQERYNDVRNQVYSGLDAIFNDVQKNERLLNLFETGIIPQASQSLNSAIAGYQTDKVDFLTLLTNQVNLFNFELDFYRILSDHHKGAAEIEALTGTELEY
jgi:outer membrane protein TolC